MEQMLNKLNRMKSKSNSYWQERIIAQLEYGFKLNKVRDGRYDQLLADTIDFLHTAFVSEGTITNSAAKEAESRLSTMSEDAKSFQMICAAHAHIDMNWMWRWEETVAIVLDTFRTMLQLMKEYPQFVFSQSQASVYKIVEEYDPAMLEEIKARIKEGRWEVTASTWVEADKNMPNGESLARHILYTKRTLSELLDIDPDSLNLDYEPDTFGHNLNVPEILAKGGVKYYYHCRGYEGYSLYRWKSPSRSSIIVYREPQWYLGFIDYSIANYVPEFCTQHNMDTVLKVYGVGDHGGGPTRRDIERLTDMSTWPVFPRIKFGTYAEYFKLAEEVADQLPVVNGELNFIFTGCYTSQSRIKTGNSVMEAKLNEAEAFSAVAAMSMGAPYSSKQYAKAWEKVLFNQFHDILPGSGTIDTREHASALYQEAAALVNTEEGRSLRAIVSHIDTSAWQPPQEDNAAESISEGAGVGYGLSSFQIPQTERGIGLVRIFHLFNPSLYSRREPVELTVWDWEGSKENMEFFDSDGNKLAHQVVDREDIGYWFHKYFRVLVFAEVPPLGYNTIVLKEGTAKDIPLRRENAPRLDKVNSYVMENKHLKVEFDPRTGAIVSMIDKSNRTEMIGESGGVFRFIEEHDRGMSSWLVGDYKNIANVTDSGIKVTNFNSGDGLIRQSFGYTAAFGKSTLKVNAHLDKDSTKLRLDVECDFREIGEHKKVIPQISFYLPVAYDCRSYKYGVPSGTIERDSIDMDVPANGWAVAMPKDVGKKSLALMAGTKYGFRGVDNSISVSLIRASNDPDPYPEIGIHQFSFAISLANITSNRELIEEAYEYTHPITFVSNKPQKGELLPKGSFMAIQEGSIAVQAIKMAEDDHEKMVIRGFETEGRRTKAVLTFCRSIKKAYFADINENPVETELSVNVANNLVLLGVEPYNLFTLIVEFA